MFPNVITKTTHCAEVGSKSVAVSSLKLFDEALDLYSDDVFGGLVLLRLFRGFR
jgi:hypothetical protein